MRDFGVNFTTERDKVQTARPFLTVVFHFPAGDLWLSERSLPVGHSYPNTLLVILQGLGEIGSALGRDFGIVDIGTVTLNYINMPIPEGYGEAFTGHRFSDLWDSDFEAVDVDMYLNYLCDDLSVESEPLPQLVATSFSTADEELGQIQLTSRLEKYVQQSVLKIARKEVYPNIRDSDDGQPFALPMGAGGAIPALKLGDAPTSGQQIYTICESPAENPVTAINDLYYDGVKIFPGPIKLTAEAESGSYPIELQGAAYGSRGNQHGYRQRNDTSPDTGGTQLQIGPFVNSNFAIQPFKVPKTLLNPRIVAILLTDVDKTGTPNALQGVILDSLGQSDLIDPPDNSGEIAGNGNAIASAAAATEAINTGGGPVMFHYSGTPVRPGQQLYLQINPQGISSSVDYHRVALATPNGAEGFGSRLTVGFSPVPGSSIAMVVYYAIDGNTALLPASDGEVSAVANKIETEFGLTDAIVAVGAILRVTKRGPDAEGSMAVSLVDVLGGNVATFDIDAAEVDVPGDAWGEFVDFRKYFPEPVLITPGQYVMTIEGGLFNQSGLAVEASDLFLILTGSGSPSSNARGAILTGPAKYEPTAASTSQPLAIVFELITLSWDKYVNGLAHAGFAEVNFKPSFGVVAGMPSIPDEVQIAATVVAEKSLPTDVFHAWATRATIEDADIDLAGSFTDSAAKCTAHGYSLDGAVTTQQTYKTLFARAAFETKLVVDWQWDKLQLKWLPFPEDITESMLTFTRANIRHKGDDEDNPVMDLTVSRTADSRLVNIIDAFYGLIPATNKYTKKRHGASGPSIVKYGEKARPELWNFLYVVDDAMLADVVTYWLTRLSFKKRVVDLKGYLNSLGIEKDDPIDIDAITASGSGFGEGGFGEDGFGGGSAFSGLVPGKFYIVQAVKYDWTKAPRAIVLQAEEL